MIEELKKLYRAQRYEELVNKIDETENYHLSTTLLILKGCCIQLLKSESMVEKYPLDQAEICFKRAIEIDAFCIDAYLELGYFYLNTWDDSFKALNVFKLASLKIEEMDVQLKSVISRSQQT